MTRIADVETRLVSTEARLGSFEFLHETISQFPNFKEFEKDLEYIGLDCAVKWLKNHATEVDTEQLICIFECNWEIGLGGLSVQPIELPQADTDHASQ